MPHNPESFEGKRLLFEHTLPAMRRAVKNRTSQIFSPKEMAEILAFVAMMDAANLWGECPTCIDVGVAHAVGMHDEGAA